MRRHRNVKIVATLGPASNDYEMIRKLVEAGADVFRLNMSHGDHAEIKVRHEIIRQIEKDLNTPIAILADLQGPKLRVGVLSKIEKPNAVSAFNDILAVSDGIMVARGDLGVELPVQAVPPIQKQLIRKCREAAKPVIVATQMLESMIDSPMPTRAEVSDVATAIYEGTDAIMLSAESAAWPRAMKV